MVYNMTGIAQNTTSLLSFTQNVNTILMGGWLGVLLLIGLSIVVLSSAIFVSNDTKKSMVVTSLFAFVCAILLRAVSLLGDTFFVITLVVAGLALAVSFKGD